MNTLLVLTCKQYNNEYNKMFLLHKYDNFILFVGDVLFYAYSKHSSLFSISAKSNNFGMDFKCDDTKTNSLKPSFFVRKSR